MSLETTEALNSPASAGDSTTGAAQAAPLFDFSAPFRDVRINATPGNDDPLWIEYRLAKPTREQEKEYQRNSATINTYTANTIQTRTGRVTANAALFAQIALAVKGIDFGDGSDATGFVDLTPERLTLLQEHFASHPSAAVDAYYTGQCVARPAEFANAARATVLRIGEGTRWFDLTIGPDAAPVARIAIEAQRPHAGALKSLNDARSINETVAGRGSNKSASQKTIVNRAAFREFLKAVVVSVEGAGANGRTLADIAQSQRERAAWFDQWPGEWCLEVGMAIEAEFSAGLSD